MLVQQAGWYKAAKWLGMTNLMRKVISDPAAFQRPSTIDVNNRMVGLIYLTISIVFGRGGGQMVSVLTFYFDDPSLNPT